MPSSSTGCRSILSEAFPDATARILWFEFRRSGPSWHQIHNRKHQENPKFLVVGPVAARGTQELEGVGPHPVVAVWSTPADAIARMLWFEFRRYHEAARIQDRKRRYTPLVVGPSRISA